MNSSAIWQNQSFVTISLIQILVFTFLLRVWCCLGRVQNIVKVSAFWLILGFLGYSQKCVGAIPDSVFKWPLMMLRGSYVMLGVWPKFSRMFYLLNHLSSL